nr:polyprotein [Tomato mild mottle virus]
MAFIQFGDFAPIDLSSKDKQLSGMESVRATAWEYVENRFIKARGVAGWRNFMNQQGPNSMFVGKNGAFTEAAWRLKRAIQNGLLYDPRMNVFVCETCWEWATHVELLYEGEVKCKACQDRIFVVQENPEPPVEVANITHNVSIGSSLIQTVCKNQEKEVTKENNVLNTKTGGIRNVQKAVIARRGKVVHCDVNELIKAVRDIAMDRGIPFENIEKGKAKFPVFRLKHTNIGSFQLGDRDVDPSDEMLLKHHNFHKCFIPSVKVDVTKLRAGTSGLVLHRKNIRKDQELMLELVDDYCVVQGRAISTGIIINALIQRRDSFYGDVEFYAKSDIAGDLIKESGYNLYASLEKNSLLRDADHDIDLSPERESIKLWSTFCTTFLVRPNGHIGCKHCDDDLDSMNVAQFAKFLLENVQFVRQKKLFESAGLRKLESLAKEMLRLIGRTGDRALVNRGRNDKIIEHPARFLYLDSKSLVDGDFDMFQKFKNLAVLFPEFVERFSLEREYISTGHDIKKCFNGLFIQDDLLNKPIVAALQLEQSSQDCAVYDASGRICFGCSFVDNEPEVVVVKIPTKEQLRTGRAGIARQIVFPTFHKGSLWEFKEGFCYANQFAVLCGFVSENELDGFQMLVNKLVGMLGPWPKFKMYVQALRKVANEYPHVREAPSCIHLVAHQFQLIHCLGQFGTSASGWHQLEFSNVGEIVDWSCIAAEGKMLDYSIGGLATDILSNPSWIWDKEAFSKCFYTNMENTLAMLSTPSTLWLLSVAVKRHEVVRYVLAKGENFVELWARIEYLGKYLHLFQDHEESIRAYAKLMRGFLDTFAELDGPDNDPIVVKWKELVRELDVYERHEAEWLKYESWDRVMMEKKEAIGIVSLELLYRDLIIRQRHALFSRFGWQFQRCAGKFSNAGYLLDVHRAAKVERGYKECVNAVPGIVVDACVRVYSACWNTFVYCFYVPKILIKAVCYQSYAVACDGFVALFKSKLGQCLLMGFVTAMGTMMANWIISLFRAFVRERRKLQSVERKISECEGDETLVLETHSKEKETWLMRWLAIFSMFMYVIDVDWGNSLHNSVMKVKGLYALWQHDERVYIQHGSWADEVEEELKNNMLFSTFEVQAPDNLPMAVAKDMGFDVWFSHACSYGQTAIDPTTSGKLVSITALESQQMEVVDLIRLHEDRDYRVHGDVGTGKSTRFPLLLSQFGRVLLLMPTRTLAESCWNSIRQVASVDPSLAYRHRFHTGTAPVSIMTYGYALAYFMANPNELSRYSFAVCDEIHTFPSSVFPFFTWAFERYKSLKFLKTSATHIGSTHECRPRFEIEVIALPEIGMSKWADMQGSGTTSDAGTHGDTILVFVASYNDVDLISNKLIKKGIDVLKVDARNMRNDADVMSQVAKLRGKIKYVVATNIIENGVTLDVDVVVDFGYKIVPMIDSNNRETRLVRQRISRGERVQRMGRVGRFKNGVFIRFGDAPLQEAKPNEVTATEAALKCYAEGIRVTPAHVCVEAIGEVTMQQAVTASKFELNQILIAHLAAPDGSLPRPVFELIKKMQLRAGTIKVSERYPAGTGSNWRTLDSYIKLSQEDQQFGSKKVPWFSSDLSLDFMKQLAVAVEQSLSVIKTSIKLEVVNPMVIAHKISTNEVNVHESRMLVGALLTQTKQKRETIQHAVANSCGNPLLELPMRWYKGKTKATLDRLERQEATLQVIHDNLGRVNAQSDYDQLVKFIEENPDCGAYLEAHSKQEFLEEKVLELNKKRIQPKILFPIVLGCVLAASAGGYYLLRQRKKSELELHGKSKRIRLQRDKRSDAFHLHAPEDDFTEEYGVDYSWDVIEGRISKAEKTRRLKEKGREPNEMERTPNVFKLIYGFNPSQFDQIMLALPNGAASEIVSGKDFNLDDLFCSLQDTTQFLYKAKPSHLNLYFGNKGDDFVHKVKLTPHEPRRAIGNTMKPMGFPEQAGVFRQSEKPVQVTRPEEMKLEEHSGVNEADVFLASRLVRLNAPIGYVHGFMHGKFCVAPRHFVKFCQTGDEPCEVVTKAGVYTVPHVFKKSIINVDNLDLIVMKMPDDFMTFKIKKVLRKPIVEEEVYFLGLIRDSSGLKAKRSGLSRAYPFEGCGKGLWAYDFNSNHGDCGGIVVAVKDRKVVGFHNGICKEWGVYKNGVFVPVTQSLIDSVGTDVNGDQWKFDDRVVMWSQLKPPSNCFPVTKSISPIEVHSAPGSVKLFGGNLTCNGVTSSTPYTSHVVKGERASFRRFLERNPNSIFHKFINQYGPSVLSKEAFYKDFFKYDSEINAGHVDMECLKVAKGRVIEYLEDAGFVKGELGANWDLLELAKGLNKHASMGALYTGKKGTWMETITAGDFKEATIESFVSLVEGKVGLWSGSQKAEIRPIEKIEACKTRVFTGAPIDVLLGAKVLVDNFNHLFTETHLKGPWTVGINKFNCGWNALAQAFNHEWAFIDADGSRFDSSITPLMFHNVLEIREYFGDFCDDEVQALRSLYTQIIYTPIQTIEGFVCKKFRGNNSGQPSTVVDNTLILMLAVEYCRARSGVKMDFKFVANGDDLILNAPRDEVPVIKAKFSDWFKECGLTYDLSKENESIKDVDFLSHRFLYDDQLGIYLPKLDEERITAILQWERSDEVFKTRSAINAALVESFGYDELFEEVEAFGKFWAAEHGLENVILPRDEIEKLYTKPMTSFSSVWYDILVATPYIQRGGGLSFEEHSSSIADLERELGGLSARPELSQEQKDKRKAEIQTEIANLKGGGSGGQSVQSGDDQQLEVVPQTQEESVLKIKPPKVGAKQQSFWVPPAQRRFINQNLVKKMASYTPSTQLVDSQLATTVQVQEWAKSVCSGYDVTEVVFWEDLFPMWLVHCIVNGTSEQQSQSTWRGVDLSGGEETQVEYALDVMMRNAKPTLRSIMRNFFAQAKLVYHNSLDRGKPLSVKASVQAGYTDVTQGWLGIDFMPNSFPLTTSQKNIRNSIFVSNVHRRKQYTFALGAPGEESTNDERHEAQDVTRNRHNLRGAEIA